MQKSNRITVQGRIFLQKSGTVDVLPAHKLDVIIPLTKGYGEKDGQAEPGDLTRGGPGNAGLWIGE